MQELFQGPRYKIEQLEDEDGQMTVHQLTISKPMHKVNFILPCANSQNSDSIFSQISNMCHLNFQKVPSLSSNDNTWARIYSCTLLPSIYITRAKNSSSSFSFSIRYRFFAINPATVSEPPWVSYSESLCVSLVELTDGKGKGNWAKLNASKKA